MERNITWQHVALVALRAALLAVLTLLGDRLAGGVPSDLIVRALAVAVPASIASLGTAGHRSRPVWCRSFRRTCLYRAEGGIRTTLEAPLLKNGPP